ncbi:MAG: DUF1638 domain-containing protein [Planctomycetota bacterium]|jgi:hypothetical protein
MARKKLKFVGCEIAHREIYHLAAISPHLVDVEFLQKGLHDLETADMLTKLQAAVDAVDRTRGYEAVVLGYGRCNDGLVGLRARDIPLVIPKAHDCITFFFGSRAAYRAYFDAHPGTYYMTSGWAERDDAEEGENGYTRPAYGQTGVMAKLGLTDSYEDLVAKYGEENAAFIAESTGQWTSNYSRYLYLKMGVCPEDDYIERTRRQAAENGWDFELRDGDLSLLRKLLFGHWDDDMLIVRPGQEIVPRNDEDVLGVETAE